MWTSIEHEGYNIDIMINHICLHEKCQFQIAILSCHVSSYLLVATDLDGNNCLLSGIWNNLGKGGESLPDF